MEIVSFLKMWMDVWSEAEEKGLKMPEEAAAFRKIETGNGEAMKEIIKFLPRREFSAENGKMAVDSLEKAVSQKNLMSILEKGQNAGENISFIEERKKKIAANMEVIEKRIQESRLGKAEESFWMAQKEKSCGCCGNGRKKKILLKERSRFLFPLGRCEKVLM